MGYPFGARQERRPTFLHPGGLPDDTAPFITRFGLELPGIKIARFELRALKRYVENPQKILNAPPILPTIGQLGRITLKKSTGCWELKESTMGPDKNGCTTENIEGQLELKDFIDFEEPQSTKIERQARSGYGRMVVNGIDAGSKAHRVIYTAMYGPIPEKTPLLDHLCENKACCWHRHTETVTPSENMLRIYEANRHIKGEMRLEI